MVEQREGSVRDRAREIEEADRRRRRREGILIAVFIMVIAGAFFLELQLSRISEGKTAFPFLSSTLFFAFWNLVLILALVVLFLLVRNLVKLFFETRHGIFGSHLRSRLVSAFILLSLGPAAVLFILSNFFISTSIERWFDPAVARIFETGKDIVKNTYQMVGEDTLHFAKTLSTRITEERLLASENQDGLKRLLANKQQEYMLDAVEVFSGTGELIHRVPGREFAELPGPTREVIDKALGGYEGYFSEPYGEGELVRGVMPIFSSYEEKREVVGAVVLTQYFASGIAKQLDTNLSAFKDYQKLKAKEVPIKREFRMILILVTLVVMFLSIWYGLYFAKSITIPISLLAEGTQEVASGNLDYRIEMDRPDEVGTLVKSFNKMTGDLKHSRDELEQRRIYIETIVANIDSGMIATDPEGKIFTVNQAALLILNKKREELVGNLIGAVVSGELADVVEEAERELTDKDKHTSVRQVFYQGEDRRAYLRVSFSRMTDSSGRLLGKVILIDDLTELVRGQRSMAWREVARRIAHEIKNPLTPIQLSAQRLLRKYEPVLGEADSVVLKECTSMIVSQVEEMKRLVDEFSSLARLPGLKLGAHQVNEILEEVVALFKEGNPQVEFALETDATLPGFEIDRDQIKRAIINLVDNAITSLEGRPGQITLKSKYLANMFSARLSVSDTGKGIPRQARKLIFEPYYSTRDMGSGLGLAIVQRIVSDHYGRIQVEDNQPKGTRFIIDLPTRQRSAEKISKESAK
jgi:two-component system nitrogen regulation sensor histidine kinase NtrY